MRVVIGVLADARRARELARTWLAVGAPRPRLHLFTRVDCRLDAAPGDPSAPPLFCLARHGSVSLWALAGGERRRSLRRRRRARRALALLYRLGAAGDWTVELHALGEGRPLGVVPLRADEPDVAALARPLLAHASGPVRVRELPTVAAPAAVAHP